MRLATRATLISALAAAAASCGGGGGGSGSPPSPPSPPVANQPPVFTSAATYDYFEHSTPGDFYEATATDPNGQALTFALAGGADASLFRFNAATRRLAFKYVVDFEEPRDANADNSYDVTLSVSDGIATVTLPVRITVRDSVFNEAFRVRRIASGLAAPIHVAWSPYAPGQTLVVERAGQIRVVNNATGVVSGTLLDIGTQISTAGEQGLLAVAVSPDFINDRTFYVHMNNLSGDTEIRRYRTFPIGTGGGPNVADPSTMDIILTIDQPNGVTNHKGGMLAFDRDDNLLIGMGDGGGGGDPFANGQNTNTLLGKLLRIDPRADDFPADPLRDYRIPAGNGYAGGVGGRPEIYALGLRNPFRGSVDSASGDIFIGDVGQGAIEEVNRIVAGTAGPINFGWPLREGTQAYNSGANSPSFTAPVTEYTHGSGVRQGQSITGGVVFNATSAFTNHYFFADFVSNHIWSVPAGLLEPGQTLPSSAFTLRDTQFTPNAGTINNVVSFGVDDFGNLYIVDIGGELFVVERVP